MTAVKETDLFTQVLFRKLAWNQWNWVCCLETHTQQTERCFELSEGLRGYTSTWCRISWLPVCAGKCRKHVKHQFHGCPCLFDNFEVNNEYHLFCATWALWHDNNNRNHMKEYLNSHCVIMLLVLFVVYVFKCLFVLEHCCLFHHLWCGANTSVFLLLSYYNFVLCIHYTPTDFFVCVCVLGPVWFPKRIVSCSSSPEWWRASWDWERVLGNGCFGYYPSCQEQ